MVDIKDVNAAMAVIKNFCREHTFCNGCPFKLDHQSRYVCKLNEHTPYYWEVNKND